MSARISELIALAPAELYVGTRIRFYAWWTVCIKTNIVAGSERVEPELVGHHEQKVWA